MITSCAPTPFMRSYIPSPRLPRSPSTIRAGNLLATTRERQAPPERTAMISWGVIDSLPAQKAQRSEEHTSELQSRFDLVCRLLLEKKKKISNENATP